VILLQQGRGGDIASAFGGSSSQAAFGARSGATLLTKATSIAAALFMILALALSIIGQRGTGSLLSGTPAPPAAAKPTPLPVPGPTAPPPATPAPAPAK
jgi:preprotein translocase subunit SecG